MSGGYSMKHIGVTILVTLMVLVLVSPLLRPKGTAAASRTTTPTPEARELSREYREAMVRRAAETVAMYNEGVLPLDVMLTVQRDADLVAIDDFALSLPTGRGGAVSRAVVAVFYNDRIHALHVAQFTAGIAVEPVKSLEAFYQAQIELAQRMPEVRDNKAFLAARSEWEKNPTPDLLKKMFDAEMNP